MFLGEFRQAMDEKGGLLLPSQYSFELASGMVVTRGFDRNLMLFSHQGWQLMAQKILNRPLSNQQSRALRRRFFSSAAIFKADQYGRIQIPVSLCDFAGLEGEVILAGMYDYLEIWNIQIWQPVYDAINNGEDSSIWETDGV
jgi:MraZ protein